MYKRFMGYKYVFRFSLYYKLESSKPVETEVTYFSSSGEEEYPKGEVVAKPLAFK